MKRRSLLFLLCLCLLSGCQNFPQDQTASYDLESIPSYDGEPYVVLNDGLPDFPEADQTSTAFERYSQLDYLGRCGPAYANVGLETMPTEERGAIGQVKPSGWHTVKYDFVDGGYLYNRCHLIGYQLTAENANELNLITGTRYMNTVGMLPFENQVAEYVHDTGNHVLYRVTPIYDGFGLVATGVEMEAQSVEDGGEGVCFHVYVYNVQPGVEIDYQTGESSLAPSDTAEPSSSDSTAAEQVYVLNTKSGKFHLPTCAGAQTMSEANRQEFTGTREELVDQGYEPCGQCNP